MRVQNQPRFVGALLIPPQRAHPWPERIPPPRFGPPPGGSRRLHTDGAAARRRRRRRRVLRAGTVAASDWLPPGTGGPAARRPGFDLTAGGLDVMWSGATATYMSWA